MELGCPTNEILFPPKKGEKGAELFHAEGASISSDDLKVLQNLQEVKGERTVFMIAHRFGALKRADLILVLEKGEIVERGNHEELLEKRGVYWALYQRQIASV